MAAAHRLYCIWNLKTLWTGNVLNRSKFKGLNIVFKYWNKTGTLILEFNKINVKRGFIFFTNIVVDRVVDRVTITEVRPFPFWNALSYQICIARTL